MTAAYARLRPRAAGPALRRALPAAVALALAFALAPASAGAWGFTGHRLVGREAARTLPDPLRRVFEANAAYLAEQAITPDLQRSGPSDPDHFLDMDAFGAYPFEAIPRVEAENIARFGKDITANLPAPTNLVGTFKIQHVVINNFRPDPTQYPTFTVQASSSRFSFEDLLRLVSRDVAR